MLCEPADSTTDHLQLLVLVSTLVAVKTQDVYLISFLSNSPRLVAWDLGEDGEKGPSLPPWPITLALGNKEQCEGSREFALPAPQGALEWGWWGGRGSCYLGLGPGGCHLGTSTTENHAKKEQAVKLRSAKGPRPEASPHARESICPS